ncbi:MAG: NADH-quinone oxidoreductase subunit J [Aquabacterium sp.]|jgi:NADH-quinone oxidoreductase subunit J|uniref:NADH-quinone oxidoreductase subunit J n=1 Tax=Aquabacterium sp. TaxID=1872578 RepID=UPI002A35C142|nr:NADH-quinone oxidoreductase subunit J [Aquabacterium sp.]MDX9844725.1 NADH-quinone oxidoreductase subunit J [Aquabacterium sp.]
MDTLSLLFYTFAFVLVYAGFRVITAKSPVTAVLHLVLAFASASCVWMLLQAEFLAISLVLVYVGAVMVLFLFVVMMLDINTDSLRRGFWKHVPVAGLIGVLIVLQMSFVLTRGFDLPVAKTMPPEVAAVPNAKALGIELFSNYLFPVQVAAVILLVGIIAAIALTLRKRKDARFQKPAEQVRVKKADRLRVHKVAAVVEAPAVEADANNQAGGQA